MNTTQKSLIISLTKQNQAFKKIKKQYNLTSKDIEILAAASILTDQEIFFSAKEIREFMGNSYYSADVAYSLLKLCELQLVEKASNTRQWFQPHTYNITGKGIMLLDRYCKLCLN